MTRPAESLSRSVSPSTTTSTPPSTTTTTAIDDAPGSMAFVASRDLGRLFEVTAAVTTRTEPKALAEEDARLSEGQVVRATRARLRIEGMWVEVAAAAPESASLGWVLESALTPRTGDVQLANTVREGTELQAADAPKEWLTVHNSPNGQTVTGSLGVGDLLTDTGGWALLENGDVWIEVADSSSGQVKGWVRSSAVRDKIEEPEVQPSENTASGSSESSSASIDPGSGTEVTTTTQSSP